MVRYRALVDRWSNQVLVYFVGMPGCQVSVFATEDHLASSPGVIRDYLRWLERHGIAETSRMGEIDVDVEEDRSAAAGGVGAIFASDLLRPPPQYRQRASAVASAALVDLSNWRRRADPQKTVRLADSSGDPVTMTGVIQHIAEMDRYYIESLVGGGSPPLPDDPTEALRSTFREVADLSESSFLSENHRVTDRDGEDWTPMKFLRRRTGHIREHFPEIAQLLIGGATQ